MPKRLLIAALLLAACGQSATEPAEAQQPRAPRNLQTALFAGGCFWSAERDIEAIPGVVSAVSGFAGGRVANPSYEQVVRGGTGHLEAVQVRFDPRRITYRDLARRFLRTIDPTDTDGQFCDRGESYRTAIFALDAGQRGHAQAAVAEASRIIGRRVATPVRGAAAFYPAPAYHQDYARRNPEAYGRYRRGCGKDARVRALWGREAAVH